MPLNYTIQIGTVGAQLIVTVVDEFTKKPINISNATALQIVLKRPDNVDLFLTASFVTNGADGQIQYITANGDLSLAGIWRIQGIYQINGHVKYTSIDNFTVLYNL